VGKERTKSGVKKNNANVAENPEGKKLKKETSLNTAKREKQTQKAITRTVQLKEPIGGEKKKTERKRPK